MKRLLAVMILSMPVCAVAGAPNAQDHAIAVHVTRSWIVNECTARGCSPTVHLNVLISGKKFELEDEKQRPVLLKPGDYRATLLRNPRAVNFAPAA